MTPRAGIDSWPQSDCPPAVAPPPASAEGGSTRRRSTVAGQGERHASTRLPPGRSPNAKKRAAQPLPWPSSGPRRRRRGLRDGRGAELRCDGRRAGAPHRSGSPARPANAGCAADARLCDSYNPRPCRPDRAPRPQPAAQDKSESELPMAVDPVVHRHHWRRRPLRAPSTSLSRSPHPSVRGLGAARLLRLSHLLGRRFRNATRAAVVRRQPHPGRGCDGGTTRRQPTRLSAAILCPLRERSPHGEPAVAPVLPRRAIARVS